jgi:hypothetical protein
LGSLRCRRKREARYMFLFSTQLSALRSLHVGKGTRITVAYSGPFDVRRDATRSK